MCCRVTKCDTTYKPRDFLGSAHPSGSEGERGGLDGAVQKCGVTYNGPMSASSTLQEIHVVRYNLSLQWANECVQHVARDSCCAVQPEPMCLIQRSPAVSARTAVRTHCCMSKIYCCIGRKLVSGSARATTGPVATPTVDPRPRQSCRHSDIMLCL